MDAVVGAPVPPWDVAVSAEKMKTMAALLRDSNPIHYDVAAVRALGLGERTVNQGPVNMAYVLNMLVAWTGRRDAVRHLKVRFASNAFAGEHLRASGVVTAVRSDAAGTLVDCAVRLDVVGGGLVLDGVATVVLDPKRS